MQRFKLSWILLIVLALMLGTTAVATRPAHAAGTTYFANLLISDASAPVSDCASANNTDCTLRDAIAAATSGSDTVQIGGTRPSSLLANGALTLSHSVTIVGPGANVFSLSGVHTFGVFTVNAGVTATISGMTIYQGVPDIVNNGTLILTNSTVSEGFNNPAGGGIDNSGTVTLNDSTIADNQAGFGAGIYSTGTATIVNSTIANNAAESGGAGGVYNDGGTLTVTNSTLTGNTAVAGGGGLYNNGAAKVANTIIAGNTPDDFEGTAPATNSHNLVGDATGLGTLGDNGGPTLTVALQAGSPAIAAGDATVCAAAAVNGVDQRGISRPASSCDIGAFQSQGLAAPVPAAWIVGTTMQPGGYTIEQYTASGWATVSGAAVHIALGPDGQPWAVNASGSIYHMVSGAWQRQPGTATDLAVGADGSVWIIGTDNYVGSNGQPTGDRTIAYWNGTGWTPIHGGAVDIAVGPDGQPWVVNHAGSIYHLVNGAWQQQPGTAHDIAVGANGAVWIIGTSAAPGGYNIGSWNGSGWTRVSGAAVAIAVGSDGQPWVVSASNAIYHMVNGAWQPVPGTAREIAVQ